MTRTAKPYLCESRAAKLDELVATYASRGAQQRRQRSVRRVFFAGGLATVIACSATVMVLDVDLISEHSTPHEISLADADQLAKEKAQISAKFAELERQIDSVKTQKQDLESQRLRIDEQSEALAKLLNDVGSQQTDLEKRQQQGSQLDNEIAALAAQRQALAERWSQFEAQGELLAMEIVAVNAQRKELEAQRQKIARQQQELAKLLEMAEKLYLLNAKTAASQPGLDSDATDVSDNTIDYTEDSLMVDNGELAEMRGGYRTGEGFDVSFGLTQTGSLNGVQQFSNSLTIDSMASGFSEADVSDAGIVLLQNGSGNFVSSGVLDSLSDGFGSVIQNTLDDQHISTTTIYDFDLHNVSDAMEGIYGEQALIDSLSRY